MHYAIPPIEVEDRRPTGEPCRCPEHILDCQCGAHEDSEAA